MSSIGTGYDLAASTFSPDGRIFQVEYALKAVETSVTAIAFGSKHGVLVAVDQPIPSKLSFQDSNTRIMDINDNIGLIGSGLYPDILSLHNYARDEANKFLKEYHKPINVKKLAKNVAEYVHIFTLGISRPFGSSVFLVSWHKQEGPKIYCIDCSGQCFEYFSWVIGKNAQAAKTEIDKVEMDRRENGVHLDKQGMMKKAIRTLLTVRDEGVSNQKIEMGWIGSTSGGKFEKVNHSEIEQLQEIVEQEMDDEDEN